MSAVFARNCCATSATRAAMPGPLLEMEWRPWATAAQSSANGATWLVVYAVPGCEAGLSLQAVVRRTLKTQRATGATQTIWPVRTGLKA